jgi:LytS/YehU family sensor histidine kinase
VQTKIDQKAASESILNLSDLLRYQLYDCSKEKVSLTGEIEYLQNYLDLDLLRKSNFSIKCNVEGNHTGINIPPLLFIPFVENAVKYSVSVDQDSFINIHFKITPNAIHFHIENSKRATPNTLHKGGLGLANVQRRLELLFPNKHELSINDKKDIFTVDLQLILK